MPIVVVAVALAGCGSNPCDGRGASCVNALVEGYPGTLDQLRISIDNPSATSTTTPNPPSSFALPVKVALVLPSGTTGPVNVGIDGLSGGQIVASAAPRLVSVPSKSTVTFMLTGGGADMSTPLDDLGAVVAISPAPFHISTPRLQAATQVFTFNNGSTAPVQATATLTGDSSFTINSDNCMGMLLSAGASCDVEVRFLSSKRATGLATTLSIGGATAAITADALPIWAAETVPPAYDLTAVVGDGNGHYWAVGKGTSGSQMFTSTGDGTWTTYSPAFTSTDPLTSVARYGFNVPLAGGATGVWNANAGWALQPVPSSDAGTGVNGLYANADAAVAVGTAGIFQLFGTTWKMSGPGAGDGGAANLNAITSDGFHSLFAVGNNSIGYSGDTSGTWSTAIGLNLAQGSQPTTLRGVWMPIGGVPNKVWAVGDYTTTSAPHGTIYAVDRGTMTATLEDTSAFPSGTNFLGIHGSVAGGTTRIYATGWLGQTVAFSKGDGTWTPQSIAPYGGNMNAVWVSDGVDIFLVGNVGNIVHYW